MRIQEVNPYIRVAANSVLPAKYVIGERIIFDYEIIYIESGELSLDYKGERYELVGGEFVFIHPGVEHKLTVGASALSQPHVHFDLTHAPDSSEVRVCFKRYDELDCIERGRIRSDAFVGGSESPILKIKDRERFLEFFYSVIRAESPLIKKGLLTELIGMLVSDNYPELLSDIADYPIENQIRDWIDAGQCLTMSLDDIAERFSYNKFYLEKRFRAAFGVGIISYRNRRRLELAGELLMGESVMSVAAKMGFGSIYSFSRAFKEHYGVSPSKYAKK